jgi:S-adenosylmethionine:tRNA ribosyltransferase-isomerase
LTADRPLRASDFVYPLPEELIAQHPSPNRGDSRLLVVGQAATGGLAGRRAGGQAEAPTVRLSDVMFRDLVTLIPAGDLLVLNTSRVRHARILATRPSGGPAEVLLIHPSLGDTWVAMGKPGSALRPGKRLTVGPGVFLETVEILADGHRRVRVVGAGVPEALARFGRLPLPPYIARDPEPVDEERYQTVYADREGSVAAPTAGLHFTPALLELLRVRGVRIAGLDLEVGPGTFKPVEVEDLSRHQMHPERYAISPELAADAAEVRRSGGAIWAVGTTVVRALESSAGEGGVLQAGEGETSLFITPGYRFRVVDHLITNFHLPRSTLLMLVCAFAGRELTLDAYRHAVAHRYRFYSYGDAMVVGPGA